VAYLPRTLRDTLLCALIGALLACVVCVGVHLPGWCKGGDNLQDRAQRTTGNMQAASADAPLISGLVREKVKAVDLQPLNASLRNVQRVTGDAAFVTSQVRDRYPIIEGAMAMLWQHVDNTVAHIDTATTDEKEQQKNIAEQTKTTLQQTATTLQRVGQLAEDLRPVASYADTFMAAAASTMQHGDHVAAHYDTVLTAPQRWYQKLKDIAITGGIWGARHL
jgi:paraquat-inducible protein B